MRGLYFFSKSFQVSRFPSKGSGSREWVPELGIYSGPGSRLQVQVPEYRL